MTDDIRRPRFFEGKILRADDLELLRSHLDDRQARHHRLLHGWGIIGGLIPRLRDGSGGKEIVIGTGAALDGRGRELIVSAERIISVSAFRDSGADPTGGSLESWYPVFVHARDAAVPDERFTGSGLATSERVIEQVDVVFGRPGEVAGPIDQSTPDLAAPAAAAPDVSPWRVLIGYVEYENGLFKSAVATPPARRRARRTVGVVAGEHASYGDDLRVRLVGPETGETAGLGLPIMVMDQTPEGGRTRIGLQREGGSIETLLRLDPDGDLFIEGTLIAEVESRRLTTDEINAEPPDRLNLRTGPFTEPERAAVSLWDDHERGVKSLGFGIQRPGSGREFEDTGVYRNDDNEETPKRPIRIYLRVDAEQEPTVTRLVAPNTLAVDVQGESLLGRQLIVSDEEQGLEDTAAGFRFTYRPRSAEAARDQDPGNAPEPAGDDEQPDAEEYRDVLRVIAIRADEEGEFGFHTRLSGAGTEFEIRQPGGLRLTVPNGPEQPDPMTEPLLTLDGPTGRIRVPAIEGELTLEAKVTTVTGRLGIEGPLHVDRIRRFGPGPLTLEGPVRVEGDVQGPVRVVGTLEATDLLTANGGFASPVRSTLGGPVTFTGAAIVREGASLSVAGTTTLSGAVTLSGATTVPPGGSLDVQGRSTLADATFSGASQFDALATFDALLKANAGVTISGGADEALNVQGDAVVTGRLTVGEMAVDAAAGGGATLSIGALAIDGDRPAIGPSDPDAPAADLAIDFPRVVIDGGISVGLHGDPADHYLFKVGDARGEAHVHIDDVWLTTQALRVTPFGRDGDAATLQVNQQGRLLKVGGVDKPASKDQWSPIAVMVDAVFEDDTDVLAANAVPAGARITWSIRALPPAGDAAYEPDGDDPPDLVFIPYAVDVEQADDDMPWRLTCKGVSQSAGGARELVSGRARVVGIAYIE